jgi:tetratricopeptide (TPR) repeat protein
MLIRIVSLLIANSLIVGCSFLPTQDPQQSAAEQSQNNALARNSTTEKTLAANTADLGAAESAAVEEKEEYASFEASTLYSLLLAEIAGQRQQLAVALANYLEEARYTRDPAIAERATRIAQYVGSNKYALEASEVWTDIDPNNALAHQSRAHALLMAGDFSNALTHMTAEFELSGDSQFDYLALSSQPLEHSEKILLLNKIEQLTQEYSDYAQLWMAQGTLLLHLEDYPAALISFDTALELRSDYTAAALSKARTLRRLGHFENALTLLDTLHSDLPTHKGIGILRARILIDLKDFNEARVSFQELSKQFDNDTSIKLSLALLHIELKEFDRAIAILSALTLNNTISNDAYFYLARIAELQEDGHRAISNYNQVQTGPQLLTALVRSSNLLLTLEGINATRDYISRKRGEFPDYDIELVQLEIELLIKEKDYPTAYQVVNDALSENPENTNLLYSRGLLSERMGNLKQLETDLRHIMSINPENAEAMNALGYTLANKTDRLEEALTLIRQALILSPNNPAIIDSLGWAYYRLGDLDRALEYLQQAFKDFPDPEVAAHLGEVLWQMERKDEAKEIWLQGLEQQPESSVILETQERLKTNSAN